VGVENYLRLETGLDSIHYLRARFDLVEFLHNADDGGTPLFDESPDKIMHVRFVALREHLLIEANNSCFLSERRVQHCASVSAFMFAVKSI